MKNYIGTKEITFRAGQETWYRLDRKTYQVYRLDCSHDIDFCDFCNCQYEETTNPKDYIEVITFLLWKLKN